MWYDFFISGPKLVFSELIEVVELFKLVLIGFSFLNFFIEFLDLVIVSKLGNAA